MESIEAEALARNDRYLREFVEALELCPFARKCRETGRLARRVLRGGRPGEPTAAAVRELEATAEEEVEVALLIYPEFDGDVRAFEELRDEVRKGLRLFYCVAFHPELPIDLSDENRAVSFLRRSPDPTLQLVRVATLDRVRSGRPAGSVYLDPSKLSADELRSLQPAPTVSEQIARANLKTLQRHDPAWLVNLLAGLRRSPGA
ncbi:MAG TPA: DUF1415 family protein [Myxococcales bacterium]|nr:DUF1415 family protein [Myxococcales bacterium]